MICRHSFSEMGVAPTMATVRRFLPCARICLTITRPSTRHSTIIAGVRANIHNRVTARLKLAPDLVTNPNAIRTGGTTSQVVTATRTSRVRRSARQGRYSPRHSAARLNVTSAMTVAVVMRVCHTSSRMRQAR